MRVRDNLLLMLVLILVLVCSHQDKESLTTNAHELVVSAVESMNTNHRSGDFLGRAVALAKEAVAALQSRVRRKMFAFNYELSGNFR